MDCSEFSLQVSSYIEGELKGIDRKQFINHQNNCSKCDQKLVDISIMLKNMPSLNSIKTSDSFIKNLNNRIYSIDNKQSTFWENIRNFNLFTYQPIPLFGSLLALIMIGTSIFLFYDQDFIPNVNLDKISLNSKKQEFDKYEPSVQIPQLNRGNIADTDSMMKIDKKNYNNKIRLVRGK